MNQITNPDSFLKNQPPPQVQLGPDLVKGIFPLSSHLRTSHISFPPCKASQEQQRSTAEGRSILGDLASLNLKSVGGVDETEEGESILVDSGGIDVSLGKASCFLNHAFRHHGE